VVYVRQYLSTTLIIQNYFITVMDYIRSAYQKHWAIGFCVGLFAIAFIVLQFTPFSMAAQKEKGGLLGFVSHIAHVVHADEGGGDSGSGDSGSGDSGSGDSGSGDSGTGNGGDCCGDSGSSPSADSGDCCGDSGSSPSGESESGGVGSESNTVVVTPPSFNLSISKTELSPGAGLTVHRGDTIKYRMFFRNTGNGAQTKMTIIDVIPANTTFVWQGGGTDINSGGVQNGLVWWQQTNLSAAGNAGDSGYVDFNVR
jgi:uncharacterized repeat protein (TIGR01451 family)